VIQDEKYTLTGSTVASNRRDAISDELRIKGRAENNELTARLTPNGQQTWAGPKQ